jgi:hypothetical protein
MKLTTVDGLTHAARIPAQWAALAVRTCECGQRFYVQVAGITECDDCLAGDAARWPTYYATTRGTTINRNEDTVKKTATKTKKTAAAPKKNALPIAKPGAVPKLVTGRLVTTGVKRDELPAEQRPSTAAERAAKKDAYIAKAAALPSTQTLSATIAANNARVVAAMKAGGVKVGQALTPGQLAKLTAAAQPDAVAAAVTAAPASFTGPDAKAKAERFGPTATCGSASRRRSAAPMSTGGRPPGWRRRPSSRSRRPWRSRPCRRRPTGRAVWTTRAS